MLIVLQIAKVRANNEIIFLLHSKTALLGCLCASTWRMSDAINYLRFVLCDFANELPIDDCAPAAATTITKTTSTATTTATAACT